MKIKTALIFYIAGLLSIVTLLMACQNSSSDDNDNGFASVTAVVTVSEVALQNNSVNGIFCFDNMGLPKVYAYGFANEDDQPDDIDGIAPDPVAVMDTATKNGAFYTFDMVFDQPGTYRVVMTCQGELDNATTDDDINYFAYQKVRIGEINDIEGETMLPAGHWSTTTDCLECHSLGDRYDVMVMNHDFVNGMCSDCHTGPII